MEHIIKISLAVFAIWYTMQEGEIFGIAQKLKLGKFADPLRDCPVCMVPWYGSLICYLAFHWEKNGTWGYWILTLICSLGLNGVLVHLFPDKETPGVHHELGEIQEALVKIGQTIKPIAQDIEEKQLKTKHDSVRKRTGH